jgi:hypothetical protein
MINKEFTITKEKRLLIIKAANEALNDMPALLGWNCCSNSLMLELSLIQLRFGTGNVTKDDLIIALSTFEKYSKSLKKYEKIIKFK